MKDYVTPKLVIRSYADELLTADIVRVSLCANEHEQNDGFNVGWFDD